MSGGTDHTYPISLADLPVLGEQNMVGVTAWLRALHEIGANCHPDDSAAEIIVSYSDIPVFSEDASISYDEMMAKARNICAKARTDIYELSMKIDGSFYSAELRADETEFIADDEGADEAVSYAVAIVEELLTTYPEHASTFVAEFLSDERVPEEARSMAVEKGLWDGVVRTLPPSR